MWRVPGLRARAEGLYQRVAGRVVGALPAPPEQVLLGPLRRRLAAAILDERAQDIAEAKAAFGAGVGRGDAAAARRELGRLGAALVGELRARLHGEAGQGGGGPMGRVGRLAAVADGWLDTDEEELLDRQGFDEARRTRELEGIDRLNRAFGSYARFAEALAPLTGGGERLTLLDIASGHGGFPMALRAMWAGRTPAPRLIASDLRDEYLELGRRQAARRGLAGVEFVVADALALERHFAPGTIDVITCTQSLHHFGAAAVCELLVEAVRHARRGVLFIDLSRAATATVAANALGVLTVDGALRHDAVLSFRKAFVAEELSLLAACVPGGERLESLFLPPAFTALRTRA